jgi:hypothetical protein
MPLVPNVSRTYKDKGVLFPLAVFITRPCFPVLLRLKTGRPSSDTRTRLIILSLEPWSATQEMLSRETSDSTP